MADQPGPTLILGGKLTADLLAGQRKLREAMIEVAAAARATPILVQRIHELERVNAALAAALEPYAEDGRAISEEWNGERRRGSVAGGDHIKVRHARAAARAMDLWRITAQAGR